MNKTTLAVLGGIGIFVLVMLVLFGRDGLPQTRPMLDDREQATTTEERQEGATTMTQEQTPTSTPPETKEEISEEISDEMSDFVDAVIAEDEPAPSTSSEQATEPDGLGQATETVDGSEQIQEPDDSGQASSTDSRQATTSEEEAVEEIQNPDLLVHWTFDETNGTLVNDSSNYAHTGVVEGADSPWWNINGQVDGALEMDGVDDYVSLAHSDTLNLGAVGESYTIAFWVRLPTNPSNERQLIGKSGRSGASPFDIRVDDDGRTTFRITDGFEVTQAQMSYSIGGGSWHHVVAVRNATNDTVRLYRDGSQRDFKTDMTTRALQNTRPITINHYEGPSNTYLYHRFFIDDVRIYNRALSTEEITVLYTEQYAAN